MSDETGMRRTYEPGPWASALTDTDAERVYLRGRPVDELIGRRSFAEVVLLLWLGEEPDARRVRLFDACLVATVDHGARAPSALAARTAAASRAGSVPALAAGILSFGSLHGAVVSGLMDILANRPAGPPFEPWAEELVADRRTRGERIPGLGHRSHEVDRRADRLFALLRDANPESTAAAAVAALAAAVSRKAGRPIPVNVDGAVAACLDEIGLAPLLGDIAFAVSRSAGIGAHVVEEVERGRPMRTIDPTRVVYDGPSRRSAIDD